MASKNYEVVTLTGYYLFPRKEDAKYSAGLGLNLDEVKIVQQAIANVNKAMQDEANHTIKLTDVKVGDTPKKCLNIKTTREIKIYDMSGEELDVKLDEIGHGSEVIASIAITEYSMRGRRGITAYVNGLIIKKLVERQHRDLFKEMLEAKGLKPQDNLPFY